MSLTVAIDGPAASGKGTISRAVAVYFDFAHLDTGRLYRAVAAKSLEGAAPQEAAKSLSTADLDRDNLRAPDVAQEASRVAAIPEVRAALLDFQRAFARRAGGAVLDGRDIGTVICPEAEVKLFVTASAEVRAERRFLEMAGAGLKVTQSEVLADIQARDRRDMARVDAPLKPADDAVLIDTSNLTIEEAVAVAIEVVNRCGAVTDA